MNTSKFVCFIRGLKPSDFAHRNINDEIRKDIAPFLKNLEERDYVEGIVLLGGLGKRDFSDEFSDVDISLFYDKKIDENKHLPFEFHYQVGERTYEFNIRELYYEEEKESEWDEFKKESYFRGNVIYDKNNRIQSLINEKTKYDISTGFERLIYIMQQYRWRGQIHAIRSYPRGLPEGAHLLLNECIELLLEAIYIINGRYQSHLKWRFSNLIEMEVLPEDAVENLREGFLIKDHSLEDIKRRIAALDIVYDSLKDIIEQKYPDFPKDPYVYTYRNKYQLVPLTFSQKMKEKYMREMPEKDSEQLEAMICINLCDNEESVEKLI